MIFMKIFCSPNTLEPYIEEIPHLTFSMIDDHSESQSQNQQEWAFPHLAEYWPVLYPDEEYLFQATNQRHQPVRERS